MEGQHDALSLHVPARRKFQRKGVESYKQTGRENHVPRKMVCGGTEGSEKEGWKLLWGQKQQTDSYMLASTPGSGRHRVRMPNSSTFDTPRITTEMTTVATPSDVCEVSMSLMIDEYGMWMMPTQSMP